MDFKEISYQTSHPDIVGVCQFKIYQDNSIIAVLFVQKMPGTGNVSVYFDKISEGIWKRYLPSVSIEKIAWFEYRKETKEFLLVDDFLKADFTELDRKILKSSKDSRASVGLKILDELESVFGK